MSDKLKFIETSKLPTDIGEFTVHAFTDENESKDHLAICMGDLLTDEPILSRIHSQCITGESFFSMRCDCRFQLTESLKQIAQNAGEDGGVVAGKVSEAKTASTGFDAQSGKYVDMVKAGIIDPTKVVRIALQDAASVAGLLITTEAMIADIPEKKDPPMGPPGGGMPDMGGMGGMGGMM